MKTSSNEDVIAHWQNHRYSFNIHEGYRQNLQFVRIGCRIFFCTRSLFHNSIRIHQDWKQRLWQDNHSSTKSFYFLVSEKASFCSLKILLSKRSICVFTCYDIRKGFSSGKTDATLKKFFPLLTFYVIYYRQNKCQ